MIAYNEESERLIRARDRHHEEYDRMALKTYRGKVPANDDWEWDSARAQLIMIVEQFRQVPTLRDSENINGLIGISHLTSALGSQIREKMLLEPAQRGWDTYIKDKQAYLYYCIQFVREYQTLQKER